MLKIKNSKLTILILVLLSCKNRDSNTSNEKNSITKRNVSIINYSLLKTFPHDTNSFTEGLFYHDGNIFESTGSPDELPKTKSMFGILDTLSGKIVSKVELDKTKYFGEGIAILGNKIYQLTYQSKIGFVYDTKTYKKIREFNFENKEGWGLTTDGKHLIISDGTSKLTYLDTNNFSVVKTINIYDVNGGVLYLNELEYIGGFIYANIYGTNRVVKIAINSGEVVGIIDFSSLSIDAKNTYNKALEMNGIAYDSISKSMYLTGKMWPKIYKISFTH